MSFDGCGTGAKPAGCGHLAYCKESSHDGEERLDRIEHLTAGWIEQSKAEHRENRELWRETQRKIDALTDQISRHQAEMAQRDRVTNERFRETDERFRVLREEQVQRDRVLDERIGVLVSAIGKLISR